MPDIYTDFTKNPPLTLEELASRFESKQSGKGFVALCPAHADHNPSLSIFADKAGHPTVKCQVGCEKDAVLAAIGLTWKDLRPPLNRSKNGVASKRGAAGARYEVSAIYDYHDATGNLLFQVVRKNLTNPDQHPEANPKQFLQRRPDGEGHHVWALSAGEYARRPDGDWVTVGSRGVQPNWPRREFEQCRRVLYRTPEMIAAPVEYPVFLVEGEKDADRLAALNCIVTTNPGGADKWRDEYGKLLRGRDVIILPDNDRAGRDHARRVTAALHGVANSITICELPGLLDKGDVSDWLDIGGTIERLLKIVEATPEWTPDAPITPRESYDHKDVLKEILVNVKELSEGDFARRAGVQKGERIPDRAYCVIVIDEAIRVADALKCGLCKRYDFTYAFNGQYWQPIEADALKKFLGEVAEKIGVELVKARHYKFRDDLLKQFLSIAYLPAPEPSEGVTLINLANGTFEIGANGQAIRPFDAKDFLTYKLPFVYDTNATAPKWNAFLCRVLPDENLRDHLAEFFAYPFVKLKLEKVLICQGDGSNGKSVLFDVMSASFGEDNISTYSLKSLTTSDYHRAMLTNKLLNYGSEISADVDPEYFKRLVSGEPCQARLPYGKPFELRNATRFVFNANGLPRVTEHTNAFFRRFSIVPFNVTISDKEKDVRLASKIIADELPGVFNWLLAGLKRLLERGDFTNHEESEKALAEYRFESDSAARFMIESGFVVPTATNPDAQALANLYGAYKTFCADELCRPLGRTNFSKRLAKLGYGSGRDTGNQKTIFVAKAQPPKAQPPEK